MQLTHLNPKLKNPLTSLRGTLLAAFVLLSIGAVGLVATINILLSTNTSRDLVFNELAAEVELSEQAITNWLDERQHDLAVIVNNPGDAEQARQVLSGDLISIEQAFLKRLQIETGPTSSFKEIFLLNPRGQVILSTLAESLGKSHQDQSYFQSSLLAPFISSPFYNLADGQTEVVITVPVRDKLGSIIGVLAGRLDLSHLTEIILAQSGFLGGSDIYIVDADHRFITKPRLLSDATEARSEGIEQALTPGPERNSQGIYENYNGVRVVGAYRWLPDLEIVLLAERAESEALAGVQQLGLISVGVAVFVVAVALASALLITSRIVQPIAALTGAAEAIAEGDFNQTVTVRTRNEIALLAQAFNAMTGRLRDSIERLREYARSLETSAEISRQITTITEADQLLRSLIEQIQVEFEFYHTHIYLVDDQTGDLVMAEGAGEVGRQLKERGHRLQLGRGIVGTVAKTNEAFLANNVDEVPYFIRNTLLPDTKSELAVPLRKGTQLLGVLDIQSKQLNRFTSQDVSLMQSIADQAAVALDNARLLAETQTALKEVERLNRRLTRQAWQEFGQELTTAGYRFIGGNRKITRPDSTAWLSPMKQAALERQLVKQSYPGDGESPRTELAVPLILRNEVIGVLGVKREQTSEWAEEEVSAVEAVADQVSRALENARLSKEQEKTIEQLKEVDRLKSEFLTSMSHELRTPLNSIIGFADVLLQGIDGDLPDLALNDVRLIHNSGQHLLALINDILDLSKIEAGKMELVREPLDIRDSIKDVLASANSLVKNKPVELRVDLPDEPLPLVYADKLRLNQIMLNLVSNAAKFTHDGSITLKPEVRAELPDRMRIAIIDTGIGIPASKLETIFDRFRQVDASTTRKYGGTGLGLAISRNLVQMHGGELGVASEEGVGSEFYFTIPLAQAVLPAAPGDKAAE
jgi:signal transduction histidine kinase